MNPLRSSYLLLLSTLLITACVDDDFVAQPESMGEVLSLSATKQQLVTRAGDNIQYFREGSDFVLYAVQHRDLAAAYDWSTAKLYAVEGSALASGEINYNDGYNATYIKGQDTLDFYAIALDREGTTGYRLPTEGYATSATSGAPAIDWGVGDGTPVATQLGDLMLSRTVKAYTATTGTVTLPFKHALTRFTFEVSKQEESSYEDRWLEGVRLTQIEVAGTHAQATLDLCSGGWTASDDACTRMAYADATGVDVPDSGTATVPDSLLLFPNDDEGLLSLNVTLYYPTKPNGTLSQECTMEEAEDGSCLVTVSYPLTLGNVEGAIDEAGNASQTPMRFQAGYSYNYSIVVLRGQVRILAIAPSVYEWIDEAEVELDTQVLGQPVTFGNLQWMDRNLGASTWDAVNDFYGAIGYYYQFGRNIPFILNTDLWVYYADDDDESEFDRNSGAYGIPVIRDTYNSASLSSNWTSWYRPFYSWYQHNDKNSKVLTAAVQDSLRKCQVNCFYTFDHKGDTVTGQRFAAHDTGVRYPGDVVLDADGNVDDAKTHAYYRYCVTDEYPVEVNYCYDWTTADTWGKNYWQDVDDQPCPKGWRLPKIADFCAFIPWTTTTTGVSAGIVWYQHNSVYYYDSDGTKRAGANKIHYWDYDQYDTKSESYIDETGATWPGPDYNGKQSVGWYRRDSVTSAMVRSTTHFVTSDYLSCVQECRFGYKVDPEEGNYTVIYMMKWQGTDKAYRIRIMSKFSKGYRNPGRISKNKRYIAISRYTADKDKTIDDYVQEGRDETMWEDPIETLVYPCAGYIVPDKNYTDLRTFGDGIVLRTSEASNRGGTYGESGLSWVQYMATTVYNVKISNSSRRSLGDQIRCCRDISVKD